MHAFRVRLRHRDLGSVSSNGNRISGTLPVSLSALTALTRLCAPARVGTRSRECNLLCVCVAHLFIVACAPPSRPLALARFEHVRAHASVHAFRVCDGVAGY
jgi:hypothetical protein